MVVLSPTNQQLNSTSFDNTCNESNFDNHHSSGVEISSIEAEDPIRTDDEMVVVSPTNKQLNSTSFDNTCNESNFGSHHSSEVEISSMEAEDPIGSDDEMVVLPTTTNSSISFDNTCNKSNFGNHHISTVEISSIDTEDLIDTDDEMVVFLPTNATKKQLESSTMNHNTTDINELQPETNQVDSLADNIEDASIKTKDVTNPEQKTDVNKSDSRTNAHKLDKTVANNMSTLENDADISEAIEEKPYFNGSDKSRKQFVEAIEQPLMEVEKPFYDSNSDNMPKGAIQIFNKNEEIDGSIAEPNTECQVNDPEEAKSLLQMPESDQINQRSIERNSSDDIKEFGPQFQACVQEVVIKIDEEAVRKIPEEAVIKISEEAGLKMPEEAGLQMLEEAGLKMPKEADLKMPEEAGLQMLEEAGLKMPKEAGLKMPEEASLQMLEEAGLKKPKEAGVKMPEEAVIKLPEDAVINMPDEAGLNTVEEAVLQLPEETVTKGSGDAVIDVSEDDIKVSEEDDIEVTEEAVAKVPREAVIKLHEEVDMEVPEEADIKLNEETVTKMPEEVVIEVSEDAVLELPEEKITVKNMEEGEYIHHEEIEQMDISENANSTTHISMEDITEPLPSVVDEHLLNNGRMETFCETNPEASVDDDHEAKEQRELDNLVKEEYGTNHTNDSRIFSITEVAINKLPKNLEVENTAIAPAGSDDIINANRLPTGEQDERDETMVMEPIETTVATENNGKSIKTTGEQHECDEIMVMEPMESKVASETNVQLIESTDAQHKHDKIMVKEPMETKVSSESNVQSIESITREEEDAFDESIENTGDQHEHDETIVKEPMETKVASENSVQSMESTGEQHERDEIMVKESIEIKVASEYNCKSIKSTGKQHEHDETMVMKPTEPKVAFENNSKSIEHTGEQHEHDEIMVTEPMGTEVASENNGKSIESTGEQHEHDEITVNEPIETKVASENNVRSMESTGEQHGHDEIMVLEPMGIEVASENNGKSIESTGEQHEHDEIMVTEPMGTEVASENNGKSIESTGEQHEHDEIMVKEPIETKVASENNVQSMESTGEQHGHDEIMVLEPMGTEVASENDGKLFERTGERDEHDEIVVKEPIETKVANNGKSIELTGEQCEHDEIMVKEPIEIKVASENNGKSFERAGEWDEHDEIVVMEPMETKVASVNNVQSMESTGKQRKHDEIMVNEPMETKVASENNGKSIKSTVEQHEHDKIMVKKPLKTKVYSESNVQSIKSITHEEEDAFDQHASTVDVRIKPCSVILTRENFEQMYATGNLMVATEQDQIPFEIKHGHKLTDDNLHESDGDDDIRKDDSQIACGGNIKSADCLFPIKTSNEQGSITEYTNLTGNSLQVEKVMTNQLNTELSKICAPLDVGVTEEVSLMEEDSIVPDVDKGLQDCTEENITSQLPNNRKVRNIWTPLDVGVLKETSLLEDDSIVSEVSMTSKGLHDCTEENIITSQFANNMKVPNIWSPLDVGVPKEVSLMEDDSIVSEVAMTSKGLEDRTEENITSQFPNNRKVCNIWSPLDVGVPKEVSSKKDDSIISEVYNHETTEELLDIMFEDNTNVMDEFCPCVAEATMNTDQGCGFDGSFVSKSGSELVLKDQIVVLLKHITSKPVVPMDFNDSQIISQEHNIEDGANSKEADPSSKSTMFCDHNLPLVENICSDIKPNSTINVCVPKPDVNLSLNKINECSIEFELTKSTVEKRKSQNVAFLQEDSKDTYVQKSCKRMVIEECSLKDVEKSALSIMPEVINTMANSNYNKTNNDLENALIDENGTYLDSRLDYQNKGVQNMQASEKYQLENSPECAASMYALEENNQISQDNVMTTTNNPLETKTIIETEVETTALKDDYSITSEGIVNINTNFSTSTKPVDNIDATEECGTTDTISAAISTSFVKPAVTKDVLDDVLDDPTNTMEEHELFDIDIYSQVEIESATDYNSESTLPSFLENDMAIRGSLLEPDTFAVDDSEVSERLKYYISVKIADRDNSIGGPMFGPCKKNINRAQESPEMSPTRQGNQMQYNEDVDGISSFPEHTCISTLMEGNLDSGRVQSDEIVSVFQLSEQEHQYYNGFIGHQTPQMMKNSQCATESSTPFVDLDLHLQSRSDEDMLSMMEVHYLMHPNAMANQLSPIENPPAIANLKQDNDLDDTGRSNSTDETKGYLTNCSFSDLENISFQDESLINTETPNSKPVVLLNNTVEKFDKVEVKVNEFDYASTDDMFKNIKKTDSPPKPKEVFVKKEKRLMDLVEKLNQESKKPKKVRLMEDADDSLYARKKTRPLPIKHISPLQNESPPKINTPAIIATPVDEVESSSEVRNKPNKVTLPNKSPNKPLEENLSLNTNVSESVLHCKPVTSLLENDNIKITSEEKIVTTLSTLPLLTETPPKSQKRQVAKVAPFARNSIKLAPANNNAPLYDPVIPNTYDTVKRRQRNTTSKYGAECSQTKPYQSSDRGKRKTAPIDHTRQLKEKCEEEKRRQRAGSSCSPNEEYSKSKSEESDHPLLGKRKSRCRIDDSERLDKRLKKDVSYEEQSRPRSRHISEERKGYAIKMEPKNERQSDIKTSAKSRFTSEEQMGSLQEKLTFKTKGSPYNYDKKPKASPSDKVDTTSYGKNQKSGVHNKPNITYRPKRQVQSPPNDDEELSSTDKRQRRLSSPFGAAVTQNPERRLTADELFDEFRKEHVTEHKRKVDLRDGNLIEKKGANELKQWPRPLYHPKQQSYEKLNVKISQPASSREVPHYLKRDPDGVRRSFEYMHGQASHAPHHDNHQMRIGYNQASRSYHGNDKCRPSSSERFRDDRSHNYPHGNRHAPYGSPQKDGRKHDLNYHLSIYNESLKRKPNFKDNWYEELASKVVLPTAHSQLFDSSTQDRNEK